MYKFVLAAIAACVFWLGFSPSDALACGGVCQKAYGPGGTAAGNGGSGYGYYPRYDRGYYNYDYPVVVRPRRVKGDPCYTPSGVETAYDPRTKRRYVVPGSGDPNRRQPTRVSAACGDTRYDATAPEPAPYYGDTDTVTSMYVNGVGLVECRKVQGDKICLPVRQASATPRKAESILPPSEAAPARRQPVTSRPAPRPSAPADLTVDQVTGRTGTLSDYDPAQ